jgi:hypothetical protein
MLKINNRRTFKFAGRKFHVADLPKADRTGDFKYFLEIIDGKGFGHIAYNNIAWEMVKFATINDAMRYVSNWAFTLDIL